MKHLSFNNPFDLLEVLQIILYKKLTQLIMRSQIYYK